MTGMKEIKTMRSGTTKQHQTKKEEGEAKDDIYNSYDCKEKKKQ